MEHALPSVVKTIGGFFGRLFGPLASAVNRVRQRPDIRVVLNDFQWYGTSPWADDQIVSEIRVEIAITNSSPVPGSVAMFRLELEGWPPLRQDPVREQEREETPFSRQLTHVPVRDHWLLPPLAMAPWASEYGWVKFAPSTWDGQRLTYGDARKAKGFVVVVVAGRSDARIRVPAYSRSSS